MTGSLEASGLRKCYGDVVALDGVDLRVEPGRLLGFLGPNGAGKTTTMRAILRLVELDGGTITWGGRRIGDAERRAIGYLPQERGLYARMRVHEQVAYFGRLAGLARAAADAAASDWIERVGLADRRDDLVQALSVGNQQRVQLAVALVHAPQLLILDEPFAGLDPVAVANLQQVIVEQVDAGVAVVFSSHQLELVQDLCEDVSIIAKGRSIADGTVQRSARRIRRACRGHRLRRPGHRVDARPRRCAAHPAGTGAHHVRGPRRHPTRRHRRRCRRSGVPRGDQLRAAVARPRVHRTGRGRIRGIDREPGTPVIGEIARREIAVRARSRTWKVVTGLLVALVVAGVVVVASLDGDDSGIDRIDVTVAITGDVDPQLAALLGDPTRSRFDVTVIEASGDGIADLAEADVLVAPGQLVWPGAVDPELSFVIASSLAELDVYGRGAELGLEPDEITSLLTPAPISERVVDDPDAPSDLGAGVGFIASILTFIGIQSYGSLIVLGVVEEKSSRVVEVLLSHVRATDLLAGKVLGIAALAIVQLVVVLAGAMTALVLTDAVDVSSSTLTAVPLVAVTFLGGFCFYALLFALAGSLVSRQEDAQQIMLPIMVPLFAGYILGFVTAESPDSLLARTASIVPFTSPFVLPIRAASGDASTWEIVAAVGVLVASAWFVWSLAGRVYEFTLLRTGSRIPVRDVLRLVRSER